MPSVSTARHPRRSPTRSAKTAPDAEPITARPADSIEPEFDKARQEVGDLAKSDEDAPLYVLFPQVAKEYLGWREGGEERQREDQRIAAAVAVAQHRITPHASASGGQRPPPTPAVLELQAAAGR